MSPYCSGLVPSGSTCLQRKVTGRSCIGGLLASPIGWMPCLWRRDDDMTPNWPSAPTTTATGVMTGTFSKPMPIGGGQSIPATNKPFAIGMVTVGHWVDGNMDHEWLFWDNADFMKQIGLGK